MQEAKDAKELAAGFKHLMLIIKAKTGDNGKMYGSVTPSNIIEQLKLQFDVNIERKKLHIEEPIRSIGDHNVEVRLHSNVSTTLKVRVESSNPIPESPTNEAKTEEAKDSAA